MGYGYNKEFVENMKSIETNLIKNSSEIIKFITSSDDICIYCPNNMNNNYCAGEENIKLLDRNAIDEYKLNLDEEYSFKEIVDNIYINFTSKNLLNVCSSCEWYRQGTCNENIIESQKQKWYRSNNSSKI